MLRKRVDMALNVTGSRVRRAAAAIAVVTAAAILLPMPVASAGTAWTRVAVPPASGGVVDPAIDRGAASVSVIVQGTPGTSARSLRHLVTGLGGRVTADLPLVQGVGATVPGRSVAGLAADGRVVAVTLNRHGQFSELSYDEAATASSFARTSGATAAWSQGNLGQGIGVAVIDTGISSMPDLDGRIVFGPDLSGEGTTIDNYGHGTVMAGVIAGGGNDSATRVGGAYTGVAPKAHVVAVKVAGRNGVVDVSTILQAMHWVSAYKDQYNIRVLNLSWGTSSTQSHTVDPLNFAVQRLWQQGIVVVVAAGNTGPTAGTITKPGDDPLVITVGAYDDKQNADLADDAMASWSSRGPTAAGLVKPDIVASGRYVISSRSYGSKVELDNPKALQAPSYIRGSGTSQAAAVVAGNAALLLAARPTLTPDQVKALLRGTAAPIGGKVGNDQGAGRIQLAAALAAPAPTKAAQTPTSSGLGSLEASRGGRNVETDCGGDGTIDIIKGEIDIRCQAWTGASWTGASWTGASWTGASWTGASWTGASWTGASWTGASWTGASWTGGPWNGASWTGASWTGASWTGSAWSGASWTGASWTGASWTGASWTGSSWTTGGYDEFLTAFWGSKTPRGKPLPGEASEVRGSIRLGLA
jgi:serine protease AprX